ncbi:MAG TPA: DUF2330 domain-containing protein [Polyangiales bacterium]|nr:DUF2330 domain-containing protein [Polyangiales bacterium]
MLSARWWALLAFLAVLIPQPRAAEACGGFFCGFQPVDQTAERIVFKVNENSVTMVTQIAYTGAAADFAWVLPLGEIPDVKSLAVFPQRALTALDANTGPQFQMPESCSTGLDSFGGARAAAGSAVPQADDASGVTVHFRAEVGPYDVAAIESKDPMALYDWLRQNSFNVTEIMLPYIRIYTAEGMKFIALKLQKMKDVSDIQPFRFDLPGNSPSIPLRMTALAAEPEMSVLVFVFGNERWNGANWPDVKIDDKKISWNARSYPIKTNWAALVARGIDEAGGRGWVTELAGSSASLKASITSSGFRTPEDMAAGAMLSSLIGDSTYVSRLYARLSAEEMTSDPIFHKVATGDVSRVHMLPRFADNQDLCMDINVPPDPCLFASCGAGGICRPVMPAGATQASQAVAGCGCLPGATARTTLDPASVSLQASGGPAATVVCQDARMSFVNPGDTMPDGSKMGDPCLNFDCGENGACVAVNMTPTCMCDEGFVAIGSFDSAGARSTSCRKPMITVPAPFYQQRLPDLPAALPGGRKMASSKLPVIQPSMDDLGSHDGALPEAAIGDDEEDDGCGVAAVGGRRGASACGFILALTLLTFVRRRRVRRS